MINPYNFSVEITAGKSPGNIGLCLVWKRSRHWRQQEIYKWEPAHVLNEYNNRSYLGHRSSTFYWHGTCI